MSGQPNTRNNSVLAADGSSFTSPDAVVDRWREHYSSILNHAPAANCADLDAASANTSADPTFTLTLLP